MASVFIAYSLVNALYYMSMVDRVYCINRLGIQCFVEWSRGLGDSWGLSDWWGLIIKFFERVLVVL